MTLKLYVIPILHLTNPTPYNVPKYLPHRLTTPLAGLEAVNWVWETYLLEDMGIILADVSAAQDTLLVGLADVLAIPALDNTVPSVAVRNRIRTLLEAANVPALWVVVGMTYRSILRIILGMFQFHNRLIARIQARLFDGSLTLDMTVSQLTQAQRDHAAAAAADLGLDYSAVTSATTIRQLLKGIGDQYAARPFTLGNGTIDLVI